MSPNSVLATAIHLLGLDEDLWIVHAVHIFRNQFVSMCIVLSDHFSLSIIDCIFSCCESRTGTHAPGSDTCISLVL